jgi:hypothetical protein
MDMLFQEVLELTKTDIFVDIGHGIGSTCLHAAYTCGCESRGIEVVYDRHVVAVAFELELEERRNVHLEAYDRKTTVGDVHFRHGPLQVPEHRDFLTGDGAGGKITKAFCNNFNGVFAEKSCKASRKYHLDNYVAGLFALMAPGSILVTLHPLDLGPSRNDANDQRRRHGLCESRNASFYNEEKVLLGEARRTVSWSENGGNKNAIYVYKYTRLEQETYGPSVFLCCNPACDNATDGTPIPATEIYMEPTTGQDGKKTGESRCVICNCDCNVTTKKLRTRKGVNYNDDKK